MPNQGFRVLPGLARQPKNVGENKDSRMRQDIAVAPKICRKHTNIEIVAEFYDPAIKER